MHEHSAMYCLRYRRDPLYHYLAGIDGENTSNSCGFFKSNFSQVTVTDTVTEVDTVTETATVTDENTDVEWTTEYVVTTTTRTIETVSEKTHLIENREEYF